jgi:gamma-glutamyltranspeptidase/glutathione hydrolase
MLSSMSPTIVAKDAELFMVTGSPGGRTIINTVLQTIVNVVDHGMNAQAAVDAGRLHHQWLPDKVYFERYGFSPDTLKILISLGHATEARERQGSAQIIVVEPKSGMLEGGVDRRVPGAGAAGF